MILSGAVGDMMSRELGGLFDFRLITYRETGGGYDYIPLNPDRVEIYFVCGASGLPLLYVTPFNGVPLIAQGIAIPLYERLVFTWREDFILPALSWFVWRSGAGAAYDVYEVVKVQDA
jgi:hypothetical protein